ncbi:MAG: ATP-dependent Clp protease ATP-binding subunit [Deltaproteobacteria bacterium]|nr:ATP-dependent Clp protease ATP-binding subunit [Deltaproteobacteria bacterium]
MDKLFYITVGPKTAEEIDNLDDGHYDEDPATPADEEESKGFESGVFTETETLFGGLYAVNFSADGFEAFKGKFLTSKWGTGKKDAYLKNPDDLDLRALIENMQNPGGFTVYLGANAEATGELEKIFEGNITVEKGVFSDSPTPNRIKISFKKEIGGKEWGQLKAFLDWRGKNLSAPDKYKISAPDLSNLGRFARETTAKPNPEHLEKFKALNIYDEKEVQTAYSTLQNVEASFVLPYLIEAEAWETFWDETVQKVWGLTGLDYDMVPVHMNESGIIAQVAISGPIGGVDSDGHHWGLEGFVWRLESLASPAMTKSEEMAYLPLKAPTSLPGKYVTLRWHFADDDGSLGNINTGNFSATVKFTEDEFLKARDEAEKPFNEAFLESLPDISAFSPDVATVALYSQTDQAGKTQAVLEEEGRMAPVGVPFPSAREILDRWTMGDPRTMAQPDYFTPPTIERSLGAYPRYFTPELLAWAEEQTKLRELYGIAKSEDGNIFFYENEKLMIPLGQGLPIDQAVHRSTLALDSAVFQDPAFQKFYADLVRLLLIEVAGFPITEAKVNGDDVVIFTDQSHEKLIAAIPRLGEFQAQLKKGEVDFDDYPGLKLLLGDLDEEGQKELAKFVGAVASTVEEAHRHNPGEAGHKNVTVAIGIGALIAASMGGNALLQLYLHRKNQGARGIMGAGLAGVGKDGIERDVWGNVVPQPKDFYIDLNQEAMEGRLPNIVGTGMEKDVDKVLGITSKKMTPNVVIWGRKGSGKTTLAEAVAKEMVARGQYGQQVRLILIAKLFKGAQLRGGFEQNVDKLIDDAVSAAKTSGLRPILVFDEGHMIVGAGKSGDGNIDMNNLLKPYMARGDVSVVMTTTGYKENGRLWGEVAVFSEDEAYQDRCTFYEKSESNAAETREILEARLPELEAAHGITYDRAILDQIYDTTEREQPLRAHPRKDIDALDRAGASLKARRQGLEGRISVAQNDIDAMSPTKKGADDRRTKLEEKITEYERELGDIPSTVGMKEIYDAIQSEGVLQQVRDRMAELTVTRAEIEWLKKPADNRTHWEMSGRYAMAAEMRQMDLKEDYDNRGNVTITVDIGGASVTEAASDHLRYLDMQLARARPALAALRGTVIVPGETPFAQPTQGLKKGRPEFRELIERIVIAEMNAQRSGRGEPLLSEQEIAFTLAKEVDAIDINPGSASPFAMQPGDSEVEYAQKLKDRLSVLTIPPEPPQGPQGGGGGGNGGAGPSSGSGKPRSGGTPRRGKGSSGGGTGEASAVGGTPKVIRTGMEELYLHRVNDTAVYESLKSVDPRLARFYRENISTSLNPVGTFSDLVFRVDDKTLDTARRTISAEGRFISEAGERLVFELIVREAEAKGVAVESNPAKRAEMAVRFEAELREKKGIEKEEKRPEERERDRDLERRLEAIRAGGGK